MKQKIAIIIGAIAFLLALVSWNTFFVVAETEQAIITQFGKPVGPPINTPGVHAKIPFIQSVHSFDKRFLEWDGAPTQVPTKDKRFIRIDTYARWKITDPLLFFQRVRDERGAQSRLDDILDGEVRNAIAKHNLVEIIRNSNRKPQLNEDLEESEENFSKIEFGREKITRSILIAIRGKTKSMGIDILDIRFKRINYVAGVQEEIFKQMISERKRIAKKFRSEGRGAAAKILGEKSRELKRIQSEAYKTAQEIKGKADAAATAIYARAYNKNARSREFYQFLKTMETYIQTMSKKDWLILSTKGDLFKFLKSQSGR